MFDPVTDLVMACILAPILIIFFICAVDYKKGEPPHE